jgi:molybdenum cofactor cytidylyltransferase
MIAAIVPAAGRSTRMGRPKPALPIGDATVLERVVRNLRAGGVNRIVVVIGPDPWDIQSLPGVDFCLLSEPTASMRASVEQGLLKLEEREQPTADDLWFLAPADHPAFTDEVVRALIDIHLRKPSHSIIVPMHAGRRGHPTLFSWRHISGIRAMPAGVGINAYVRQQASETLELPVEDPGVLVNLDTPGDYERLCSLESRSK